MLFFFFSSRRRHTRCYRDWSSDVCSSDLLAPSEAVVSRLVGRAGWHIPPSSEPIPPVRAEEAAEGKPAVDTGVLLQPNPDGTILVGGSREPVVRPEPEDPAVPRRLLRA